MRTSGMVKLPPAKNLWLPVKEYVPLAPLVVPLQVKFPVMVKFSFTRQFHIPDEVMFTSFRFLAPAVLEMSNCDETVVTPNTFHRERNHMLVAVLSVTLPATFIRAVELPSMLAPNMLTFPLMVYVSPALLVQFTPLCITTSWNTLLPPVLVHSTSPNRSKVPVTEMLSLAILTDPPVIVKLPDTFSVPVCELLMSPPELMMTPPAPTLVVRIWAQLAVPLIVRERQEPALPSMVMTCPAKMLILSAAAGIPAGLHVDGLVHTPLPVLVRFVANTQMLTLLQTRKKARHFFTCFLLKVILMI